MPGYDEISRLNQGFNQMAQQQLAKQEKETRQKFISDISHEFQNSIDCNSRLCQYFKRGRSS